MKELKDETLKNISKNTGIPVEKLVDFMPEDETELLKNNGIILEYPNRRLNGFKLTTSKKLNRLKFLTPEKFEKLENKLLGRKYKRAMKKHRREKAREARKDDSESSL